MEIENLETEIEKLRLQLISARKKANRDKILKLSRKLDKLIISHMKKNDQKNN